ARTKVGGRRDLSDENPAAGPTRGASTAPWPLPKPNRNPRAMSMSEIMMNLRELEQHILANGRVDGPELEALRKHLYASGTIDRRGADFLVELYKRVEHRTPAFEHFFYRAIKDHILKQGRIDAEEAVWLRRMLFADRKIEDQER